jgi:Kef-type K+ transport system membrane component KefB
MESVAVFFEDFKNLFSHHIVFSIGLLLLAGYFAGKLAEKGKLPAITGYIIAGLLLGDSVIGMIPEEIAFRLDSVTETALGIVAITIGAEFDLRKLRRIGRSILMITFFQAIFAFIFVTVTLSFFGMDIRYALILGSIATATAPAATVIIIRELRARGDFVDYLYAVVALDDAICVIIFSIIFALVAPMLLGIPASPPSSGTGWNVISLSGIFSGLLDAFEEMLFSCIIGFVGGILLHLFTRKLYKLNEVLIISIAIIFLTTSVAIVFNLSLLIANMVLGAVLINLSNKNRRIFSIIEPITPPLFALFFVIAGTEFNIKVFAEGLVIIYGVLYILSRFGGKYVGTYLSAMIAKAPEGIKRYLGFCLFPQAGVAIGLVLFVQTSPVLASASTSVQKYLVFIVNIVLLSIFVNELIGPVITKFGIKKGANL